MDGSVFFNNVKTPAQRGYEDIRTVFVRNETKLRYQTGKIRCYNNMIRLIINCFAVPKYCRYALEMQFVTKICEDNNGGVHCYRGIENVRSICIMGIFAN